MFEDYYNILGVGDKADPEEIKRAYRELAKKYHPDKNTGKKDTEDIFKRISEAYNTLSDDDKRRTYDQKREYYLFQKVNPNYSTPPSSAPFERKPSESTVYDMRKREYTPKAWMYGKIVIILIITLALLIPYGIYHISSVYHFEKGLELEAAGNISDAYYSYLKARSRWGARNLEATYRLGDILLERGSSRESIGYFLACYDYTNNDSIETWLHYKTGLAYGNIGNYRNSLEELALIPRASFLGDSAVMLSAEIRTYRARLFREGIEDYKYLIDQNIIPETAWFGTAWCYQNLFQYPQAIEAYNKCLEFNPENAIALFYRGSAYYYESDSIRACSDFYQSSKLGYPAAVSNFENYCTDSLKSFYPPDEIL